MPRKGLGKGLDSLIPNFYNEDFDSESPQSLEDMLSDGEETVEDVIDDITSDVGQTEVEGDSIPQKEEIESEKSDAKEEIETQKVDSSSEDLSGDKDSEEDVETSQEIKIQKEHVEEVKKIVDKNPRITLWSSRSSAVFRYLRKTEPEFSISKEASILIDEAVSKKYPEIWALFDDE